MKKDSLVTGEHRVEIIKIDLNLAVKDFLNAHAKGEDSYTLSESDRVLRQKHLPDDAQVLWTQMEHDDAERDAVIDDTLAFLVDQRARDVLYEDEPEPVEQEDGSVRTEDPAQRILREARNDVRRVRDALVTRLERARYTIPPRYLLVGIESESFAPVIRGNEPLYAHPFDYRAFMPSDEKRGEQ